MAVMETLSQAIARLSDAGYAIDFRASDGQLECDRCETRFDPSTVRVDEIVRFEGASDPGDAAILYALDAGDGHRGLYAAAYGADVSAEDSAVIGSLPNHVTPDSARPIGSHSMTTERGDESTQQRWGEETRKAIENFAISGEPVPLVVIHWLGRIKAASASANLELGLLDPSIATRIVAAANEVAAGQHDDQFPIDIFQTGSGTSTNMNANEVIASLAGHDVHPNDHVNLGQSSNDVFPTAVHLASVDLAESSLLPALVKLETALSLKESEFADHAKAGRTHLMDAVPITLGQEFGGYAAQTALGAARLVSALKRVKQVPLGGTAVGSGLNTHPDFARLVLRLLNEQTSVNVEPPSNRFEAQASRDALVELSGSLKTIAVSLTKIAGDIAWLASGPRAGLGEIALPTLQKGSSIMPGKVNPVLAEVVLQVAAQVIGNDTAITIGGMQGNFELNARVPLIARNLIDSLSIMSASVTVFADRCVSGIEANTERLEWLADNTLASATALNPVVGYDEATRIVQHAQANGLSVRQAALASGVDKQILDAVLDPRQIARGNSGPTAPQAHEPHEPTRSHD